MHKIFLTTFLLSLILASCTNTAKDQSKKDVQSDTSSISKDFPKIGKIEVLDPAMLNIVDSTAQVEKLADGMTWAEGPVWVKDGNYLLYSDTRQNIIYQWSESAGLQEFIKPAGFEGPEVYSEEQGTNGLLINQQGQLVACDHGNRRIAQIDLKTKKKETLVGNWEGKKFNSPNDIAQHPNGDYYFTDPPYGLPGRENDTETKEIKENGVYKANQKGEAVQVVSNLARPNGIAISADAKQVFVALSDGNNPCIMAYDIKADGLLSEGRIFFDFKKNFPEESLAADGIKVDANGNMYAAAGDGVVVINSTGKPIGRIRSTVHTANCAFGADGYLYLTSTDQLLRIKLKI